MSSSWVLDTDMLMNDSDRIRSAQDEAEVVAAWIVLIAECINQSVHAPTEVEAVSTTIVYKRDGKTFHLVVHDMTDFKP